MRRTRRPGTAERTTCDGSLSVGVLVKIGGISTVGSRQSRSLEVKPKPAAPGPGCTSSYGPTASRGFFCSLGSARATALGTVDKAANNTHAIRDELLNITTSERLAKKFLYD